MAGLAEQLEKTDFHDSELGRCFSVGDALHLHFRNIGLECGKDEYYAAHIVLRGVRKITQNDVAVSELNLESESSDVLQFHRGEGRALLLIEWGFYRPRKNLFAKYEVEYDKSDLTAEKQDELIV